MSDLQFWILIIIIISFSAVPWLFFSKYLKRIRGVFKPKNKDENKISIIQNIITSLDNLTNLNKGATIIIDELNECSNFIADQEYIYSEISANLITSIFEAVNSPLHDGAIVINDNKIKSASAFISRLSTKNVPNFFGTRHRSALGLCEVTKAIIVVLSEETKNVYLFKDSQYKKINKKEIFEEIYES